MKKLPSATDPDWNKVEEEKRARDVVKELADQILADAIKPTVGEMVKEFGTDPHCLT